MFEKLRLLHDDNEEKVTAKRQSNCLSSIMTKYHFIHLESPFHLLCQHVLDVISSFFFCVAVSFFPPPPICKASSIIIKIYVQKNCNGTECHREVGNVFQICFHEIKNIFYLRLGPYTCYTRAT